MRYQQCLGKRSYILGIFVLLASPYLLQDATRAREPPIMFVATHTAPFVLHPLKLGLSSENFQDL